MNLRERIEYFLSQHPQVHFEHLSESQLFVQKREENGFSITIQFANRKSEEHVLYLDEFHIHIENSAEGSEQLYSEVVYALSGVTRLEVHSKGGVDFKWVTQFKDVDGQWCDTGEMTSIRFDFWRTPKVRFLQNSNRLLEL